MVSSNTNEMKSLWRRHGIYLCILLILSAYAWRFIPEQVIRSDGFMYFISQKQQEFFSRTFFYTGFELSAAVLGLLLPKLYGMNISWYWWTTFGAMLVTHVLFYWLAVTIFKKPTLSFIASLIFALNFFGNWDMYSTHCYCFVLERIYPVLFLLPSGVYLHRFLERRNSRDFTLSLIFYFIGLGIGHWSLFITAFFLLYPICWAIYQRQNSNLVQGGMQGIAYLGITLFFVFIQRIHESVFKLKWSVVDFLFHPEISLWPQQVARQFVHWTQYPVFLQGDFSVRMTSKISDVAATARAMPYIVLVYIFVLLMIYRFLPERRTLLATAFLGTVIIFIVNVFFGQYDVLYQPGSHRYLYYPNMMLAFFWTLFIEVLITRRDKLFKSMALVGMGGYILVNMRLIGESYRESMGYNVWTRRVFEYIQAYAPLAPRGTLIVAPYDEIGVYESIFFTEQLAAKGVRIMSVNNTYPEKETWQRVASESARVIFLEKDESGRRIKEHRIK